MRLTAISIFPLLLTSLAFPAQAADGSELHIGALTFETTYKAGADFARLPLRVGASQSEEQGMFAELGLQATAQLTEKWSLASDVRAFAAGSQISSTFDDIETGRTRDTSDTDSYLHLRRLWLQYSGLTEYPGEHLALGLQRIRSTSLLWWDSDIESLTWEIATTRLRFQTGIGQRFATYRTNTELSELDRDKLRLFTEAVCDWTAYHELNLRAMYTDQSGERAPADVLTDAPDGVNGEWLWLGLGLSSNWMERRGSSPIAYNFEWIGLTGNSDFLGEDGQVYSNHDIRAWAFDAGIRYDFNAVPASIGLSYSQGSGGFDSSESNLFVQTGLHTNRGRFAGNSQYLFRFNEAFRPDLTNLQHASLFGSWTVSENYLVAGALSTLRRDDPALPLYRNGEPLVLDSESEEIGTGIDLSFRHDFDRTILSVPIKFWRVRGSALLPGDAFVEGSDHTIYRAVFELVGSF